MKNIRALTTIRSIMRTILAGLVTGAAMVTFTACTATPGDTITEIEDIENGLSVETYDGREYAMRDGIPCGVDDRLSECTDRDDRLVEHADARAGDDADRAHVGEESAGDDQ